MKFKSFGFSVLTILFLAGQAGCQSNWNLSQQKSSEPKKGAVSYEKLAQHQVSNIQTPQQKIYDYLLARHVNGSVAIVKNNKIIFNGGVGYSNFAKRTMNSVHTTYPIGSITKVMTATAIMQLQEQGKLNVNDPVAKYIPGFVNGENIRLKHLLSHTSGIQDPIWHVTDQTPISIIKKINKRPVTFDPGTTSKYRDSNYLVLAYIIEKVTGQSLMNYIQKNIFDKAHMTNTGFIIQEFPHPFSSSGYKQIGQQISPNSSMNIPLSFGNGDIYATAYDLVSFDRALMAGKLVSKKSLKEMQIPRSDLRYGYGLYNYGYVLFSKGGFKGWISIHGIYKNHTFISILLNVRNNDVDIHKTLYDVYQITKTIK